MEIPLHLLLNVKGGSPRGRSLKLIWELQHQGVQKRKKDRETTYCEIADILVGIGHPFLPSQQLMGRLSVVLASTKRTAISAIILVLVKSVTLVLVPTAKHCKQ